MPDSLPELLDSRNHILQELSQLGDDFQPGSIATVNRRCGKPTCHLRSTQRPRTRSPSATHPEDRGQDGHADLIFLLHRAQSRKGNRPVSSFSNAHAGIGRGQPKDLSLTFPRGRGIHLGAINCREKTGRETIQQEISREVEHWLQLIFSERHKCGRLDLEAVEMAIRSAMHQVGGAALSQLLQFGPAGEEQRQLSCSCGHMAKYLELRAKSVLTAVGEAPCLRPYYLWASDTILAADISRP
jgi:hypothetical protein